MQIHEGELRSAVDVSDLLGPDPSALGIVVLDREGHVETANDRARELLGAETPLAIAERLRSLTVQLSDAGEDSPTQSCVEVAGSGHVFVRRYMVGDRHIALLHGEGSGAATQQALQHASRHRAFTFFARDWAHDLKGMLHVIRINGALLGRLLQRDVAALEPPVTKCLDAIPREVERLDRAIELLFSAGAADRAASFDVAATCDRVVQLVKARATRQRVEVALETSGAVREITGFENEIQTALLNLAVNSLEAMPDQGRLLIQVEGAATEVIVRVCDTGPGLQPRLLSQERLHLTNGGHRTGIGLPVTGAIVDAHGGRMTCVSNVPQGTCIEITLPTSAPTERFAHGSRTHR